MSGHNGTEVYRKLILLMMYSKRAMWEVLEQRNMTPVQGSMLMLFEPGARRSMNSLSKLMGCDASNITGLVDRLDSNELIERTTDPTDRRVKLIKLSDKGIECRQMVLDNLKKSQAADLHTLTDEEQEQLIKIIDKLTAHL